MPPSMMLHETLVRLLLCEHVEVGVHARVGHRLPPVAAVGFGGFDGGRHAPIAQREQGLVERMTLGFDIEEQRCRCRRSATLKPLWIFLCDHRWVFHRQPLIPVERLRE
jgi:hypothetical protein